MAMGLKQQKNGGMLLLGSLPLSSAFRLEEVFHRSDRP